jgi:hypothetical protein
VPARTALYQNVPNPFNPVTTIQFDLAQAGHATVGVYDVEGRIVATLLSRSLDAGPYSGTVETTQGLQADSLS